MAAQIGNRVENAILDHLGHEHELLRTAAGQMVAAMQDDLGHQRAQIRELLAKLESKDAEISALEGENFDLVQCLAASNAELASLKKHISGLEKEEEINPKGPARARCRCDTAGCLEFCRARFLIC